MKAKAYDLTLVRKVVDYYNEHNSTVRKTADKFDISKSAVHRYLTLVMPNPISQSILETNKEERSFRGGMATKKKWSNSNKK